MLQDRSPDDIIATTRDGQIRVAQFIAEARSLAEQLPQRKYAINLHNNRYLYLRAFCAALIAGQCTLMPPNRQPRTLSDIREVYPDNYLIGENGDEPLFSTLLDPDSPDIDEDQLCAIAFTSGSTGTPRPNRKYWRTIYEGAVCNVGLFLGELPAGLVNMVATVPPQHNYGLEMSVALPLLAPIAIHEDTPFFPQDIANIIMSLDYPVVLVSSPIHLEALLRSGVRIERIERVFSATAPLAMSTARNLEVAFNTRVQDVFGSTETGIFATRRAAKEELWEYSEQFELRISDNGVEIRAGHLPENAIIPDIVELVGNRQYRWLGRQADMVNIAGKRGSIADINHQLRRVPGVVDGVVFARDEQPDRLAALVVAPGMETGEVLAGLKERVEPVFLPRPIYKVDMLPRQETGKIAVKAVNEMFERIRADKPE